MHLNKYNEWLQSNVFDKQTKDELLKIKNDTKEIEDRFYKKLDFGTAGLRGIIGAGDNRMNKYTVMLSTQGLANFILKEKPNDNNSVVIAYDSRNMSPEFADYTASVLNANGIKCFVFTELRPAPELSFAVRHLNCTAGIVITASHNPKEYNGYKVYWEDGAQITYPIDENVINEVKNITSYDLIKTMDKSDAINKGLYNEINYDVDEAYYSKVLEQIVNKEVINKSKDDLNIVFTPIHGTGLIPVTEVLNRAGFKNVHVVKEQANPDPLFSTVEYPNPENPKVFNLAIKLANDVNADIIVGTDPDADRVGAVVKNNNGEYIILSGNQTGVIITEYILSQRKKLNTLPKNSAVVSSIVSTDMTKEITNNYNCTFIETLTGFKYIGEKIKEFEKTGDNTFIFGFEESFGSLAGTYARDKDAIVSTLLLCEIAGYYKLQGKTLFDALNEIYEKYGYYTESIEAITLTGSDGIKTIQNILTNFRNNPPTSINNSKVIEVRDYLSSTVTIDSNMSNTNLPKSNVLYYVLDDGTWFCIRPSGTEPKIKVYFGVKDSSLDLSNKKLDLVTSEVLLLLESYK